MIYLCDSEETLTFIYIYVQYSFCSVRQGGKNGGLTHALLICSLDVECVGLLLSAAGTVAQGYCETDRL